MDRVSAKTRLGVGVFMATEPYVSANATLVTAACQPFLVVSATIV